jgi:hypothetical protein
VADHWPARDFHEQLVAAHSSGETGRQHDRDESVYWGSIIIHAAMIEKKATILNEFPSDCCVDRAEMRKVVSQGHIGFSMSNDIDVSRGALYGTV